MMNDPAASGSESGVDQNDLLADPLEPADMRGAALREWHAVLAAVRFLTRLPTPQTTSSSAVAARDLAHAVRYFPLVGAVIGLMTACVCLVADHWLSGLVAVVIALVFEAVLTGGFHEDAVADTCDALGGGWTRDDILRIMKDSRIGSYGALGLFLALMLRIATLAELLGQFSSVGFVVAVVASAVFGRWLILVVMWSLPPVTSPTARASLAKDAAHERPGLNLLVGSAWMLPLTAGWWLVHPWNGLVLLAISMVGVTIWIRYLQRVLGGVTGDCLGATCYAGQVGALVVATGG